MLSLNNLVLMLYSNEKASLVRLGCVSVSLYVKLVNTGKVNIATLNSIVPHIKRKTPTASCLLSLAHAQNVSVSLKCHSDTDTQIWANGKECGEVSTGIYWNGMQNSFFLLSEHDGHSWAWFWKWVWGCICRWLCKWPGVVLIWGSPLASVSE